MKKGYTYIDRLGSFRLENPEDTSFLYFPLAGESGLKSSITPLLGGDSKIDQNTFLLQPTSTEELHNLKSTRNFWCVFEEVDGKSAGAKNSIWSATGNSSEAEYSKSIGQAEESVLEAGFMWHKLQRKNESRGLKSTITSFVPCDKRTFEIMEVTLENISDRDVTFTPVAAIPVYGRSADNVRDHKHVTSLLHRTLVTKWGLQVTPTLTFDERGHKKNTLTYFVYGSEKQGVGPSAVCPRVMDFIGEGGSLTCPKSLLKLGAQDGDVWQTLGCEDGGWETMGALMFAPRTLKSGEKASYQILMGITAKENKDTEMEALIADYAGKEAVDKALSQMKEEWINKVNVHYETGNEDLDGYLYWVTFQPILRRIYGCSFLPYHDYGKGGRGWRDLWQDCLALLIMEPDGVRDMLVSNYGGVRMDGTNATIIGQKQGEFVADRNSIVRVWMDHGLWPFMTTEFYIKQTGDIRLFEELVPYFKDALCFRGQGRDEKWDASQGTWQLCEETVCCKAQEQPTGQCFAKESKVAKGTILEHILLQNITAFYDVGEHGHIKLRGADWNDGFDMAVENGESVAFTAAYGGNLAQIASLVRKYAADVSKTMEFHEEVAMLLAGHKEIYDSVKAKQDFLADYYAKVKHALSGKKVTCNLYELADVLEEMSLWIKEHIRQTEWVSTPEGSFYNGYYDNHSRKLEGVFESGTRMTLTGQVFPIMSGTATDQQVKQMAEAADKLLYRSEAGGYCLNSDFHEVKDDMGRAFGFAYGHKENGAVFAHMAVMYGNALYRRGFIKEGYKALNALYKQSVDFENSRMYPGLPEYFSERGRGMYPYLTGSASWLMMTMVTEVYGVKGEFGDLCIAPKLVGEQLDEKGEFGISLMFNGVKLHVKFKAQDYGACNGTLAEGKQKVYTQVKELRLNGQTIDGNVIPKQLLEATEGVQEIQVYI